jgi:hypothetical protein
MISQQSICRKALSNLLSFCLMIWNIYLRMYEKQCCITAIIVMIVKTMFRFWPTSLSSLNQSCKPWSATSVHFYTFISMDKSWDNMRSSAAPYTESRLTHSVANECTGFPVVKQSKLLCTLRITVRGTRSPEDQLPSTVISPGVHHHLRDQKSFVPLQSVHACLA